MEAFYKNCLNSQHEHSFGASSVFMIRIHLWAVSNSVAAVKGCRRRELNYTWQPWQNTRLGGWDSLISYGSVS